MIGMFVATLPYRIKLDPHWSFDELVKHVREKCLSILEHSHYPLQHILADSHLNQSNVPFLETVFDFITVSSDANDTSFGEATFEEVTLQQSYTVAKFDVSATFVYNSRANNNKLSCYFVCSRDLFDETTIARTAGRFEHLFEQLFSTNPGASLINQSITSISKLSLILPNECDEIRAVIFRRLESIVNEGM
jgi:non-ribosomal peptide synthetase component F